MKKLIALGATLIVTAIPVLANNDIPIYLNNTEVTDVAMSPQFKDGRLYAYIGTMANLVQASASWNGTTAVITKDGNIIELTIDSNIASINGEKVELDAPAYLVDGDTMVPVRFIAEALDISVQYVEGALYVENARAIDPKTKTFAYIKTDGNTATFNPIEIFASEDNWNYNFEVDFVTDEYLESIGLLASDIFYPTGFYFYDEAPEQEFSLNISPNVEFNFVDFGQLFVSSDAESRDYTTSSFQEFYEGSCYHYNDATPLSDQRIPYELVYLNNEIISITEYFLFTQ